MLTLRIPLAASHRKPFSRGLNKLFIFLVASESCCGTRYPLNSGHYLGTPAGLPEARTYNSSRAFSKFPEGHSALEGDEKCVFCMGSLVPQQDSAPGAQRVILSNSPFVHFLLPLVFCSMSLIHISRDHLLHKLLAFCGAKAAWARQGMVGGNAGK